MRKSIIIPNDVRSKPSRDEISAAYILLDYFEADIKFIPRRGIKTPDFLIKGKYWELKSPTGNGKRNLQHTVTRALAQSQNIIIDARNSKIDMTKIQNFLRNEASKNKRIKSLLLIDKQKKVVEIVER